MGPTQLRLQAIRMGEAFYSTGKPCRAGHISPRYASTGLCKACTQAKQAFRRECIAARANSDMFGDY